MLYEGVRTYSAGMSVLFRGLNLDLFPYLPDLPSLCEAMFAFSGKRV